MDEYKRTGKRDCLILSVGTFLTGRNRDNCQARGRLIDLGLNIWNIGLLFRIWYIEFVFICGVPFSVRISRNPWTRKFEKKNSAISGDCFWKSEIGIGFANLGFIFKNSWILEPLCQTDARRLEKTFKNLGFTCHTFFGEIPLSKAEREIRELAKCQNGKDMFSLCLLTHGDWTERGQMMLFSDGSFTTLERLTEVKTSRYLYFRQYLSRRTKSGKD